MQIKVTTQNATKNLMTQRLQTFHNNVYQLKVGDYTFLLYIRYNNYVDMFL